MMIIANANSKESAISNDKIAPSENSKLYKLAANSRALYYATDGMETKFFLDKSTSGTLANIESFVREIEQGPSAFRLIIRNNVEIVKKEGLAKYYGCMKAFLSEYSPHKVYSPHVQEFFNVCINKYQLTSADFPVQIRYPVHGGSKEGWVVFNEIVQEIYDAINTRVFKRKLYSRADILKRGFESSRKYLEYLFQKHSRLLVLRIDLSFRFDENDRSVGLEEAQSRFSQFLNNRRYKELYENEVGYVWRMECGGKKGYHYHLFFFFDGSKSHKDAFLAGKIGEDWVDITEGKGIYYNCNANKAAYSDLAIGMVSHDDFQKRESLLKVLSYLHKMDQFLREKFSGKSRTWGRGEITTLSVGGPGRPRRSNMQ